MVWCERRWNARILALLLTLLLRPVATHAQPISTNTPIPPLQWINLTSLLGGAYPAPPLKDATIGYDDETRLLLIFGGESSQGFPQSETYFLDLDTLTWINRPAPSPDLAAGPSARTAAITGYDSAASYRRGQLVVGGKASDGTALSDVWEYSYNAGFWSQVNLSPGGPSPRWGAAGGNDRRTPVVQDQFLATPNNSLYLAGGVDGTSVSPLSDVWRLNVTGTLSSNSVNTVEGSWEQITISASNIPSKVGVAGAVVSQGAEQIVAIGGCTTTNATDSSYADPDSYIINVQAQNVQAPKACPAARTGGTVVPNFLGPSSSFGSQMLYMLGTVNASLWDDGGGLEKGEVDILRIDTGAWSRILPAGDPGTNGGSPAYPSPRQGASAVTFSQTLVGTSRDIGADTLVFGGRDASGNYLSELWVLRAYNATITQSGQTWSGYGNGQLQSGINADGTGVTVQYMTTCATALSSQSSQTGSGPTSTGGASGPSPTQSSPSSSSSPPPYDVSVAHKALAPVSVALSFAAVIIFRLSSPSAAVPQLLSHQTGLFYSSVAVGIAAFVLGIVGLVTSFTSITSTSSIAARSSSGNILKTSHGKAGIALFVLFYGVVPALFASLVCYRRTRGERADEGNGEVRVRVDSAELPEKMSGSRVGSPLRASVEVVSQDPSPETRQRVRSWGGLSAWPGIAGRRSSESAVESTVPTPSQRSFEVTNRPARTRRASGNSLAAFSDPRAAHTPRNLSDLSWFNRRASANAAGESDFALGVMNHRGHEAGTPATTAIDMMSTSGLMTGTGHSYPTPVPEMPPPFDGSLHALFHALLLALCVLSLVQLWSRAPKAAFIIFLIGTIAFYFALLVLACYGKPRVSILSTVVYRLRGGHPTTGSPRGTTPVPSRPLSTAGSEIPFPDSRSPYQHHQPPFRTTMSVGLDDYPTSVSHGHGTAEVDDDDEDDEDTRQRRIEEEMSRRDVSIVTVPRRKLFLTNPEESRH
ncbi:hypothetical protein B0H21DRAFT_783424 [Amylocystis lapponica]|nr:hypothetical protein B0H21DRAFT_783424 [Amylocystis lapponica]